MVQFITFGFACTPLYLVWEKAIGIHESKSLCKRALARLPVVIPIWFLAIVFPFFGPINSTVGSLLVSFTVYIIPALAHIFTFKSPSARQVHCIFINFNLQLIINLIWSDVVVDETQCRMRWSNLRSWWEDGRVRTRSTYLWWCGLWW